MKTNLMFLGIEIGGTKLQLGVGRGDGSSLIDITRARVDPEKGAEGILSRIVQLARPLIEHHKIRAVGIGFGGPVDTTSGHTITSHQVEGWNGFGMIGWCQQELNRPAVLGNDSDLAGLGEARFGAGRGQKIVFYSNVGSGIGGALVVEGQLYGGSRGIASELGHLRPGPQCTRPQQTVESLSSGWAIAAAAQDRLTEPISHPLEPLINHGRPSEPESVRQRLIEIEESDERSAGDLLERCDGNADHLTAAMVVDAATDGNTVAIEVLERAVGTYGWALAQMITLLSPHIVVIGGGVSLAGEELFFAPLRRQVTRYVFPPLRDTFHIAPATLGEEVVVHGALALAAERGEK